VAQTWWEHGNAFDHRDLGTKGSSMTDRKKHDRDHVEQYADSLGITPEELFEELDVLETGDEADGNCLSPEEVRIHCLGKLGNEREAHLFECADCRALVVACQPDEAKVQEFMNEVATARSQTR
jgi:hypothetical protein